MLTFPFGSDAKFTLIPKINDEPIPQSEMVDLTIKVENRNRGVSFTPLWNWNDVGIEIEIQRDQIKVATSYTVVLDWRRPDATYSDGFQDRMNYCTLIQFSTACNIVSEDTVVIEVSPAYKGDPGDSAYQVAVDNGFEGTQEEWIASLKGEKGDDGETIINVYDNSSLRVWLSPQSEIPDEQEDGIIYIGYEDQ